MLDFYYFSKILVFCSRTFHLNPLSLPSSPNSGSRYTHGQWGSQGPSDPLAPASALGCCDNSLTLSTAAGRQATQRGVL